MHGDEVKMGETVLSFHIHSGTDTCDGCEPGQVMAHLSKHKREDPPGGGRKKKTHIPTKTVCGAEFIPLFPKGPGLAKEDKESLRQKELKQMKAKYGLQVSRQPTSPTNFLLLVYTLIWDSLMQSTEYEETKSMKNPKYRDRAESRRQTVGSEGAFQRDDAPASVHEYVFNGRSHLPRAKDPDAQHKCVSCLKKREISEVNKGRKMLEKMGWKKGEGLGKEGTGMKDPVRSLPFGFLVRL